MVMKRNMMRKNLTQTIRRSLGRYLAIVAIIALGCAIFVGLKITKKDMVLTGQEYMDELNMFDLRLLNTYGWTQEQVERIGQLEGIADAEGCVYLDAYANHNGGEDKVFRFYAIPEKINRVYLLSGRLPQSDDECLVDASYFGENAIGDTIHLGKGNEKETANSFSQTEFTIVGRISSPLYMDMTRGNTTIGSGTLATYIYVPRSVLDVDYFAEIYVTLRGDFTIYSDAFTEKMDTAAENIKPNLLPLAQQRFDSLKLDAEKQLADGLAEYEDGRKQFEEGKLEAEKKLADALQELLDAQTKIDEGILELEDGEQQIADAQAQIDEGLATLEASQIELENAKAESYTQIAQAYGELMKNYKLVTESIPQVEDGLTQIDAGIAQIDDGLEQIEENRPLLELMLKLKQTQVEATENTLTLAELGMDEALIELLRQQLEEQTAELTEYQTQLETLDATKLELETTRAGLLIQRAELVETQKTLKESLSVMEMGFVELDTSKQIADNQFAAAEAQINAGFLELEAGQAELNAKIAEFEAGKQELLDGQAKLEAGWAEYESGKAEAEAELAEAEAELADAKSQLEDAREAIENMDDPDVYAMTRNTNAGYMGLDSNSDIVYGVAEVLPVFFLLIAALVCITTLTRMVEEERTQIGTLKALGHSSRAIMSKYLCYSISAAVIGCVLGITVGCTFFPILLWNAYGIIFNIRPDIVLSVDWELSLGITAAYLISSTLVTWYCCNRTLREVPAQLIRPKSPDAGKKIILEYLPIWKKLSFLNKVMLRNVVRYKQRLLMMIIGIGGCTALLLTGFGLNDTIVGLADAQFADVNHFDIQVVFSGGKNGDQQKAFEQELRDAGVADSAGFFYQASAELDFDGRSREIYLIAADQDINGYLSFRWDEEDLPLPGKDEALLSIGIAEIMGVSVGDTITVRNADMKPMEVKVSGLYENHVYNYVVVSPETVRSQWEQEPAPQMAYLLVRNGVDVHDANGTVTAMDGVLSTQICEDTANMFNSMMDALALVIVVIIFCAGLLGAIVLYNLTNININERIREIATIKVLGFNAAETSAYVFKENILLTVLGVIFGLPLGLWFLDFVMEHIKIDMVWFKTNLTWPSYVWSVVLTLLCAAVVDFIFHKKLDRINMAEALKSVE